MRKIIHQKYGCFQSLLIEECATPTPQPDEILVNVHATTINDWDAGIFLGEPYVMRLSYGVFRPKLKTPGCDIAGVVEAVGSDVSQYKIGDCVYGDLHHCGFGGFADYVCVPESAVVPKPESLTFVQAAAVPHAATLAWQGLNRCQRLKAGMSILVNGAGGGVGAMVLQLAKQYGVKVTGVDSSEKLSLLKEIGFDQVIDYQTQDFTRMSQRYDLIFDVKTNRLPFSYLGALKPGGYYLTIGGSLWRVALLLAVSGLIRKLKGKHLRLLILEANKGLREMAQQLERGQLVPVVDGPYPLNDFVAALKYYISGEARGRVVLSMSDEHSVNNK